MFCNTTNTQERFHNRAETIKAASAAVRAACYWAAPGSYSSVRHCGKLTAIAFYVSIAC